MRMLDLRTNRGNARNLLLSSLACRSVLGHLTADRRAPGEIGNSIKLSKPTHAVATEDALTPQTLTEEASDEVKTSDSIAPTIVVHDTPSFSSLSSAPSSIPSGKQKPHFDYDELLHTVERNYFDYTLEHLDQLNVNAWFSEHAQKFLDNDWAQVNETGLPAHLAKEWANVDNFGCPPGLKTACNPDITPENILRHTGWNWSGTEEELMKEVRLRYLTIVWMTRNFAFWNALHNQITEVLTQVNARAGKIRQDFSPEAKTKDKIDCMIYHELLNLLRQCIVSSFNSMGRIKTSGVTAATGPMTLAGEVGWYIGNVADFAITVGIKTDEILKQAAAESKPFTDSFGGLHFTNDWETGICSGTLAEKKDQALTQQNEITFEISKVTASAQSNIRGFAKAILHGDPKVSLRLMEGMLGNRNFFMAEEFFDKNIADFTSAALQSVENQVVTTTWQSNGCHIACQIIHSDEEKEARFCDSPPKDLKDSRVCFRNRHSVCQTQCMTYALETGNQLRRLPGIEHLNGLDTNYHFTVPDVVNFAFNRSLKGHVAPNHNLTLAFDGSVAPAGLPICVSTQLRVKAFDETGGSKYDNHALPCTCGDWSSDKTKEFYNAMGLAYGQPDSNFGKATELMQDICPDLLRDLDPAPRFLAECELGISFPKKGDKNRYQMKPDRRCGAIRKGLYKLTPEEASTVFCGLDKNGPKNAATQRAAEMMEEEQKFAIVSGAKSNKNLENSWGNCNAWKRKHRYPGYKDLNIESVLDDDDNQLMANSTSKTTNNSLN